MSKSQKGHQHSNSNDILFIPLNCSQKDQGQFSISFLDERSSGGSSSRTWLNEVKKRLRDGTDKILEA
jgi:hypothetical protein